MLKNYFKVAVRLLKKYKGYSLINIAGLSVGMACTILILLWVQDELSYDRFHENADRLFRVTDYEKYSTGEELYFAVNPPELAPLLKSEYPEIIDAVRYEECDDVIVQYGDKKFIEDGLALADANFFKLFTYPFIRGNENEALTKPNSIVITEKMADKYFGAIDPIGKMIKVNDRVNFLVTGIIHDVPSHSHQQFDFIVPFEIGKEFNYRTEGWNSWAFTTYVLLDENADFHLVDQKIADTIKRHLKDAIAVLSLQPLPDIHLGSGSMWGLGGDGDIRYVYIFSIIAGFILLIACINFMNLATARSGNRAREVAIRKVSGAGRKEIIGQFYGESILLSFISLILAYFLIEFSMPFYNALSGKELDFNILNNSAAIIISLAIAIITGIIAGSYPAMLLSAFKPIKVLKGKFTLGRKRSTFRNILVSIQFTLAIFLIIGSIVINRQLQFIRHQKLGFNKEHVLYIELKGELVRKIDLLKNEFRKDPNVVDVSAVSSLPSSVKLSIIMNGWDGRNADEQFLAHILSADYDLLKTLDLEMADGRYFSPEFVADTSEGILVNEAAVRAMGMAEPLGKRAMDGRIIGVIKDFHFGSLHSKIGPLLIFFSPNRMKYLLVRTDGEKIADSIQSLRMAWQKVVPDLPFEFAFLDEQIDRLYRTEQRVEDIMNVFTFLALSIACLGLFGLAAFTAQQRTKEIGIRKVLGASVVKIVRLLTTELAKWVIIANLIAWPVAWYAMSKWLQNFAYRISIDWWIFAGAGILALTIALLTVIRQAIKAALANPVDSLRNE